MAIGLFILGAGLIGAFVAIALAWSEIHILRINQDVLFDELNRVRAEAEGQRAVGNALAERLDYGRLTSKREAGQGVAMSMVEEGP